MLTDQEKKELRQKIQSNQHEVFVISMEEMDAIIKSSPKGKMAHVQKAWQKLKGNAEAGANYAASADDLRVLAKLVGDLGSFTAKAYIKSYGGKPHIILKGHPGLRTILTGTKYGIKNPKVVAMGLGKAGAINAAKTGGLLSVVLLSAYRVIDYFLTDEATLTQLIGSLATDVVKVGIATGASIGAAALMASFGVTVAIGPILAVVVAGFLVTSALTIIDERYGLTDKVIAGLDELSKNTQIYARQLGQNLKNQVNDSVNEITESIIDYAIDTARRILINTAKHHLNKLFSTLPSV